MSVAQHTGTVTGLKSFKQTKWPTTASGRPGKFKDPLTDQLWCVDYCFISKMSEFERIS